MNDQAVDLHTGSELAPMVTPLSMLSQAVQSGQSIEVIRELMAMSKELAADEASKAFNMAMKDAQAEMRPVAADANNPQTKSKYASYSKLDSAVRPIYTRHGFSLSFDEGDSPSAETIRVLCYVAHEAGHTRTYRKDMPADGKGAKGGDVMTKTHATGAATSYGMRYLLKMIFNVSVGEDDTDGNEPDTGELLSDKQVMDIGDLFEVAVGKAAKPDVYRKNFLAFMKVQSLSDIRATDYRRAVEAINSTMRAKP